MAASPDCARAAMAGCVGAGRRRDAEVCLPDLRRAFAAAVAHAATRLWRRKDIEEADQVILDLRLEALVMWGQLYCPEGGGTAAVAAVAVTPEHVRSLVEWSACCRWPSGLWWQRRRG